MVFTATGVEVPGMTAKFTVSMRKLPLAWYIGAPLIPGPIRKKPNTSLKLEHV